MTTLVSYVPPRPGTYNTTLSSRTYRPDQARTKTKSSCLVRTAPTRHVLRPLSLLVRTAPTRHEPRPSPLSLVSYVLPRPGTHQDQDQVHSCLVRTAPTRHVPRPSPLSRLVRTAPNRHVPRPSQFSLVSTYRPDQARTKTKSTLSSTILSRTYHPEQARTKTKLSLVSYVPPRPGTY